ncbi:hypothetical protein [Gilliamella sp. W8128]|uniref:hypothetical protein n=1 Tax=Gilliamella sp. W8128 TaxID=2751010 RepID=UPI0018DC577C|nr:hypothetical protein [Gilliamella sp. W8128]MBI0154101.1 hypothetical protein [Gilliamella sp. W8128]
MFGIQIFDDDQRDVISFIQPIYILDFFHIDAWTNGQKTYSFENDLFTFSWVSSFGQSDSNAFLNVEIFNNTLKWACGGYSFDIFVFLRAI